MATKQTYYDKWHKVILANENKIRKIMDEVVTLINEKLPIKVIFIGNHYFGIIEYNNHEVPAMAHKLDFEKFGRKALKPIYDEFGTTISVIQTLWIVAVCLI